MAQGSAKRIAVIGASGFLGQHIVKELQEWKDADVLAIDKIPPPLHLGRVESRIVDITNKEFVENVMFGIDYVIHVASLNSITNYASKAQMRKVNVDGTANVIDACRNNGVKLLVYVSSLEAASICKLCSGAIAEDTICTHATKRNPYAESKLDAENFVQLSSGSDLYTVVIRPPGIYGEYSPLLRKLYKDALGRGTVYQLGLQSEKAVHSRVYAGNVAHMVAMILFRTIHEDVNKQVFYCYDETPMCSYAELNSLLFRIRLQRSRTPISLCRFLAKCNDVFKAILNPVGLTYEPLLTTHALEISLKPAIINTKHAGWEIGYYSKYSWKEAAEKTRAWLQNSLYKPVGY
ncbi:putative isomerase [Bufonid herpesvirus 1]|uniref:putative isomerase n=1 Tax=Bufonid herpesvirus 1 TaxID=2282206 RepID=UPI000EB643B5|nr:putative isomerase [Bufonid herpesvirus 1]AXF48524.1 putative isomerase [Bufonid herpesvirus 1]